MATGYRASFYPENPRLRSIEILGWAAARPCFTVAEARRAFDRQLGTYKNPDHEISERLRKLLKSGMITWTDPWAIEREHRLLQDKKAPRQAFDRLSQIRKTWEAMQAAPRRAGRPARLYFVTQAGLAYVERRESKPKGRKR